MKFLNLGSIRKNLALLVLLSVIPALILFFRTGMEQRDQSYEEAKRNLTFLTSSMVEVQKDISKSARQILSTLSLLPEIKTTSIEDCREIFASVLEQNQSYLNIALSDLNGNVLVSGRGSNVATNLKDRKHFQQALEKKDFAVGEYIISRIGDTVPAFAFAYPVISKNVPVAVLSMTVKLTHFLHMYNFKSLPEKSFLAVTDHRGIRLFYYPENEQNDPIGKPIKPAAWKAAQESSKNGIIITEGSDGIRRILAFEKIKLPNEKAPYIYVWAGIPEAQTIEHANLALFRNILFMILITIFALLAAWILGRNTLIKPINDLVEMTNRFAEGNLEVSNELSYKQTDEFGKLTRSFQKMARALTLSQETLRDNEARFRLLMNSLDAMVYASDMETYEILFINEYGKRIHGDITGKVCWQSMHKNQDGPCAFCTNKLLLDEHGNPKGIHTWESASSATGKCFQIRDRAIQWVDGRIVRLEIASDISEIKQVETRLAEETERLQVTLSSIGDSVITTDTSGKIICINKAAEHLTGWSDEEASGQPLDEILTIIDEESRQPCPSPIQKMINSGQIIKVINQSVLLTKSGQEKFIASGGAPIKDRKGKTIGLVVVFRDITEQLRNQIELIKVKKLESIGILAGGIAHDFNNILTAIVGNIDLARMSPNIPDRTKTLLEASLKASLRARDLTQQLLTFAKGGEPIKETSSLAGVVKDSADFMLRGGKIAGRYSFPEDLWLVDIDKGQISQVIQNIVLNSCHAMPDGGVIEITCENWRSNGDSNVILPSERNYVKISIIDHGIGMPANVLDKIFDPYFSTKQQGSGLGLAITNSIIVKHGGQIQVTSTPGIGTTFTIFLPASKKSCLDQTTEIKEITGATKSSKIMVMDDEELIRIMTKDIIEEFGHEVVLACDGEQAIKVYREAFNTDKPIDLTLMDLTIPGGMGGREAIQAILAINPAAKVIVASGYSNDPVMANYSKFGFCSVIAKPFHIEELKSKIDQFIS